MSFHQWGRFYALLYTPRSISNITIATKALFCDVSSHSRARSTSQQQSGKLACATNHRRQTGESASHCYGHAGRLVTVGKLPLFYFVYVTFPPTSSTKIEAKIQIDRSRWCLKQLTTLFRLLCAPQQSPILHLRSRRNVLWRRKTGNMQNLSNSFPSNTEFTIGGERKANNQPLLLLVIIARHFFHPRRRPLIK